MTLSRQDMAAYEFLCLQVRLLGRASVAAGLVFEKNSLQRFLAPFRSVARLT
jgi:hypothetical protein